MFNHISDAILQYCNTIIAKDIHTYLPCRLQPGRPQSDTKFCAKHEGHCYGTTHKAWHRLWNPGICLLFEYNELHFHLLCWQLIPHGDLKKPISISEIVQQINCQQAVAGYLECKDKDYSDAKLLALAEKRKHVIENLQPIEEEVKNRQSKKAKTEQRDSNKKKAGRAALHEQNEGGPSSVAWTIDFKKI